MQFPLQAAFKLVAIASQISVTDKSGHALFYVKQKAFKLKEAVTVFTNSSQSLVVFRIEADNVFDFSGSYHISDPLTNHLGTLKRLGMASLWKATYEVQGSNGEFFTIREANPWAKFFDGIFSQIPLGAFLSGYIFHPVYELSSEEHGLFMSTTKEPALWEGRYRIERQARSTDSLEALAVASLLMVLLLERSRG
jgi:uncharacterized protein YxjI